VRVLVVLCLLDALAKAQTVADPADRIRASMQASLDAQRASVRLQQERARAGAPVASTANAFFTVPWPSPAVQSAVPMPVEWDCERLGEPQLAMLINDAAERESLKPSIVRAVVETESAAHPCAVSAKGARGLMQLMPATAAQLNVGDPFDPKQNIDAGTRFLRSLLTRYNDDLTLALGAYNAGAARVDREGGVPEIPETRDYIQRVLSRVKALDTQ
jgi:soluble lytic murein transglycosylase-like protein